MLRISYVCVEMKIFIFKNQVYLENENSFVETKNEIFSKILVLTKIFTSALNSNTYLCILFKGRNTLIIL
jgi:hypothetical protein